MDEKFISEIKECGDDDAIIEILEEGKDVLITEFDILYSQVKKVDPKFAILLLEESILFLNTMVALVAEKSLQKYKIKEISIEQMEKLNTLIKSVNVDDK